MIGLFTDFGLAGPYVGQMHAVIAAELPAVPVIDLFHDVPAFDIRAAAYLLPPYTQSLPGGSVCVAVVDPGVGGSRRALMVQADGRWFVGPDNGLFVVLRQRSHDWQCREIRWRPAQLSASFHGRDLFAPVAVCLARGEQVASAPAELYVPSELDWPADLPQVLYVDRFGNGITGLRAGSVGRRQRLRVCGRELGYARVFHEAAPGQAFWYENSSGLIEIALAAGRAEAALGFAPGEPVEPL